MGRVTYTDLRHNLAHWMDEAIASRDVIVVTRQGGKGNVVMMSEDEFRGWQETIHLLRSPTNTVRLMRSIANAERGRSTRPWRASRAYASRSSSDPTT